MLKILEFIFESPIHYFGIIILILITCYGISYIVQAGKPDPPINLNLTSDQYADFLKRWKNNK
jgi:hypothetical protein